MYNYTEWQHLTSQILRSLIARHQMRPPIKNIRLHYENAVITYIFFTKTDFTEEPKNSH